MSSRKKAEGEEWKKKDEIMEARWLEFSRGYRQEDSEQKQEAGIRSRGFSLGVDPKSLLDPNDVRPRARLSTWWQDLLLSRQMVFDVRLPDKAA